MDGLGSVLKVEMSQDVILGALGGCLGCILEALGGVLDACRAVLEALGNVLEASWRFLNAFWRLLRRLGGHVEPRQLWKAKTLNKTKETNVF